MKKRLERNIVDHIVIDMKTRKINKKLIKLDYFMDKANLWYQRDIKRMQKWHDRTKQSKNILELYFSNSMFNLWAWIANFKMDWCLKRLGG